MLEQDRDKEKALPPFPYLPIADRAHSLLRVVVGRRLCHDDAMSSCKTHLIRFCVRQQPEFGCLAAAMTNSQRVLTRVRALVSLVLYPEAGTGMRSSSSSSSSSLPLASPPPALTPGASKSLGTAAAALSAASISAAVAGTPRGSSPASSSPSEGKSKASLVAVGGLGGATTRGGA